MDVSAIVSQTLRGVAAIGQPFLHLTVGSHSCTAIGGVPFRRWTPLLIVVLTVVSGQAAAQGRSTRFWNLTENTISAFYLAPSGTSNWGPNQCKNDRDGAVDPDERLRITDVTAGNYDAKIVDVTGRACVVRDIKIEVGAIFSIEEKDLTSCDR
jgi:hypothetical protein